MNDLQYVYNNTVNYTTVCSSDVIIGYSNDNIYVNSSNYILSVNDNTINGIVHYNNIATLNYTTVTSTSTTVLQCNTLNTRFCNTIIYNIILSFTSSDITSIASDDTITFTVNINNNKYTYVYPVQPLYMNMYELFDTVHVNDTITTFSVTATSTTPLTLFNVDVTSSLHEPHNCFILC